MRLAGASLAVGKQAGVVAFPGVVEDLGANFIENVSLILIVAAWLRRAVAVLLCLVSVEAPKTEIKGKLLFFTATQLIRDHSLCVCHLNTKLVFSVYFWQKGPNPDSYLNSTHNK